MPGRKTPLVVGEYYHIFNRGNEKRNIFTQPRDYKRLFKTLFYYQFIGPKPSFSRFAKSDLNSFKPDPEKKLVEIICYCLMPNHFHFLVKQLKNNGISVFLSQISNSYTKYFNTKYARVGALFQGVFKSIRIETDEQLVHISRYIHLNPIVAGLTKDLNFYPWSSYHEYISGVGGICSVNQVLDLFPSSKEYQEFVEAQIDYGTTLEILKHRTIDLD
ncbi:MAG: transposase [Candidatus Daviesbacteria bacterium]|nr:transposase [Candidatus Daviesbacteria bacterium]